MFLKLYVIALIFYIALDLVWISLVAKKMYKEGIGFLTKDHPNLIIGSIIYPLLVGGLVFFVVQPALLNMSSAHAAIVGAFFGLVAYGSYDLTNFATIRNWPLSITVIDIVWGMIICSSVAALTYLVSFRLGF